MERVGLNELRNRGKLSLSFRNEYLISFSPDVDLSFLFSKAPYSVQVLRSFLASSKLRRNCSAFISHLEIVKFG